jgi:hypothetical protein
MGLGQGLLPIKTLEFRLTLAAAGKNDYCAIVFTCGGFIYPAILPSYHPANPPIGPRAPRANGQFVFRRRKAPPKYAC